MAASLPPSQQLQLRPPNPPIDAAPHNFPKELQSAFEQDAAAALQQLKDNVHLCSALHDIDRAGKFYLRRAKAYLDAKYPLTIQDRIYLGEQFMKFLFVPECNLLFQAQFASTIARLIKKKYLVNLIIPWRPLYDLLCKVHYPSGDEQVLGNRRQMEMGQIDTILLAEHGNSLRRLIKKARRYFPPSATKEILEELQPQLCPFDNTFVRTQV